MADSSLPAPIPDPGRLSKDPPPEPPSRQILTHIEHPAWERQPGESSREFQKFAVFRDLPIEIRSLSEAARQLSVSPAHVKKLSFRMQWAKRAAAWDDEKDRELRRSHLKSIRAMNERHAKQALAFQTIALNPMQALAKRLQQKGPAGETIDHWAGYSIPELFQATLLAQRLWSEGLERERLAMGETTQEIGTREVAGDDVSDRMAKIPESTRHLNAALYSVYQSTEEERTGSRPADLPAPLVPQIPEGRELDDGPEQEPPAKPLVPDEE